MIPIPDPNLVFIESRSGSGTTPAGSEILLVTHIFSFRCNFSNTEIDLFFSKEDLDGDGTINNRASIMNHPVWHKPRVLDPNLDISGSRLLGNTVPGFLNLTSDVVFFTHIYGESSHLF